MGAILRFLIISATIIIPWGIIRIADLESKVRDSLNQINISDLAIIGLLLLPPITLLIIKWLFEPRSRQSKRYSGQKDMIIKFGEKHGREL
jgi:hypothetical protein